MAPDCRSQRARPTEVSGARRLASLESLLSRTIRAPYIASIKKTAMDDRLAGATGNHLHLRRRSRTSRAAARTGS
jgi:hypothetical protein